MCPAQINIYIVPMFSEFVEIVGKIQLRSRLNTGHEAI